VIPSLRRPLAAADQRGHARFAERQAEQVADQGGSGGSSGSASKTRTMGA